MPCPLEITTHLAGHGCSRNGFLADLELLVNLQKGLAGFRRRLQVAGICGTSVHVIRDSALILCVQRATNRVAIHRIEFIIRDHVGHSQNKTARGKTTLTPFPTSLRHSLSLFSQNKGEKTPSSNYELALAWIITNTIIACHCRFHFLC